MNIDNANFRDEIVRLYQSGIASTKIPELIPVTYSAVRWALAKAKIVKRPKNCFEGYQGYRKWNLNEDYFEEIDTGEKAYILGLLYTDGNITGNTLQLGLKSSDVELLEIVKNRLKYDGPIFTWIDNRKSPPSIKKSLRLNSIKLVEDLARHGMYPNKTFTIQWPKTIPDEFLSAFILGCLDGDGCWSEGNGSPIFSIVSATESFLMEMQKYLLTILDLNDVNLIKYTHYHKDKLRKNPLYNLRYAGWYNCQLLHDYLYRDATIWLSRKRDRIENTLNSRVIKKLGRPQREPL